MHKLSLTLCLVAVLLCTATITVAAEQALVPNNDCRNTGRFSDWLTSFKREAAAQGISPRALAALDQVGFDQKVVSRDRRQGVFAQTFLQFAGRMVSAYRLKWGRSHLKKYRQLFQQIEQQYGVPGAVITAFWGLETDFGANNGDFPTLTALATLAFDCRRSDFFRSQLLDALRLIDTGDINANEMRGAWAGELGQVQFLPSDYYLHAVDFDGDGRRQLIASTADALASAANHLRFAGWQAGEPWLQEVRVPRVMPWEQADLHIQHPRAQWVQWGVRQADGKPLIADETPAALLLPMGRHGPAFLAYRNFYIYLEWNQSLVYSTTSAYFATRLAGADKVRAGNAKVNALSLAETKQLQHKLAARSYDVGQIDGIIGARTRAAVRQVQLELELPADAYPTQELLRMLR